MTESSVKNFQLCVAEGSGSPAGGGGSATASLFNGNGGAGVSSDDVVLQFGRVAKHKFSLDVKYPLSLVQVQNRTVVGPQALHPCLPFPPHPPFSLLPSL